MTGETTGAVRAVLRIEGACVLAAALYAYARLGLDWSSFAWLFFVPDISFLGYLAGPRTGALVYNSAHSYIGAIACAVAGYMAAEPMLYGAGIIWCAHIGFDRALGYGLKYTAGFGYTHLGVIGRFADTVKQAKS